MLYRLSCLALGAYAFTLACSFVRYLLTYDPSALI